MCRRGTSRRVSSTTGRVPSLVVGLKECAMRSSFSRRLAALLAVGLLAVAAQAQDSKGFSFNFSFGKGKEEQRAQEISAQLKELDQRLYAYADRYTTLVVSAADEIVEGNTDADQRRLAHQIKLVGTSSIYDIVTNPDPFTKLMDLLLVVTLQSYTWIDEDRADKAFGARSPPLIRSLRTARTDIWKLASGILKPDQLQRLDNLILESRKDNPDVSFVSFMRFNEVSAARNKSVIAELKTETGLFSSISEATKVADEARLLAERAFYQTKRMPFLMNWQMEALLNETLAKPEIRAPLQGSAQIAEAVNRVSLTAEKLPQTIAAERTAIFEAIDKREPAMSRLLVETRKTAAEARELSQSGERLTQNLTETTKGLNTTLASLDAFMTKQNKASPPNPNAEPFRIEPYVKAAAEINQTVAGVNTALANSQKFVEAKPWQAALADADALARARIDQVFWRAAMLIGLFFVLLLAYRVLASRLATAPRSAPRSAA
jgi:hypothetical protein